MDNENDEGPRHISCTAQNAQLPRWSLLRHLLKMISHSSHSNSDDPDPAPALLSPPRGWDSMRIKPGTAVLVEMALPRSVLHWFAEQQHVPEQRFMCQRSHRLAASEHHPLVTQHERALKKKILNVFCVHVSYADGSGMHHVPQT